MRAPTQDKTVVRIEVAPSTIAWVLAVIAGVLLVRELWVIGLLVMVALVFAGTFNPLIERLERLGIRRTFSLVLVFLGSVFAAALVLFLTVPPLLEQLAEIVRGAPELRERLIVLLGERRFTAPLAHVVESAGLEQTFARLEAYLLGYSPQALKVLGYFATSSALSIYMLADAKRTKGTLYALVPRAYHMRLARILHNLEVIVGGYMRGQFITSAAIGVFTLLLLLVCKVPNALPLALFAALTDVIPFVGGILAAGPAVLSALSVGMPTAGVVGVSMFLYMEFETKLLVPKVYGSALRLSTISVVLALLAGGTLLGVMGALLALPVAAGLQMMLEELRVEMPGDDSDDRLARARNAKTEAAYERMSAGSTAQEAGQIAGDLAHELRDAATEAAARQAGLAAKATELAAKGAAR